METAIKESTSSFRRIRRRGIHRVLHGREVTLMNDEELIHLRIEGTREHARHIRLVDIQALITGPTRVAMWANIVLTLLILGFIWGIAASTAEPIVMNSWLVALIVTGLFLLVNVLLGPTCSTYVLTGAQTIYFPQITRRRAATQLFEELAPTIAAVQGVAAPLKADGPAPEPTLILPTLEVTPPSPEPTVRDFT
jgi:hypothetical protein